MKPEEFEGRSLSEVERIRHRRSEAMLQDRCQDACADGLSMTVAYQTSNTPSYQLRPL